MRGLHEDYEKQEIKTVVWLRIGPNIHGLSAGRLRPCAPDVKVTIVLNLKTGELAPGHDNIIAAMQW